jgi:2-polyprenyl-3-methyl-5-hydroxy-6-metoxy-1,4-benzoquinol methylase
MTENEVYSWKVCNICGGLQYNVCYHFEEFSGRGSTFKDVQVIKCSNCGVRRRKPDLEDEYEESYHSYYFDQGKQIHPHMLSFFADLMTARLRSFGKSLKFADIGCSTGRALALGEAMGFDVTGFDVSKWSVEHACSMGYKAYLANNLKGVFAADEFDVVHCSHVIEHVPNPLLLLDELRFILQPGGLLMLACPNYSSLPRLIKGKNWGVWCLDSHLWQFTRKQMVNFLRSKSFKIISVRTLHGFSPDSRIKSKFLSLASTLGYGDGLNIIAQKQ